MDNTMKEKWLVSLRSSEYEQCVGTLHGEWSDGKTGFCCLGVFADAVLGIELDPVTVDTYDDGIDEGPNLIYDQIIDIIGRDEAAHLMLMNDKGKSFSEIADYIEKEL